MNMKQSILIFLFFVALVFSANPAHASEKLSILIVPLDLKGSLLSDHEYLNIVTNEMLAKMRGSGEFNRVEMLSTLDVGSAELSSMDFMDIAREKGVDVLFTVKIGKGKLLPTVATHKGMVKENNPNRNISPYLIIPDEYKLPAAPEKNYNASFNIISVMSEKNYWYNTMGEPSYDEFSKSFGQFIPDLIFNFPLKKGKVIGIDKDQIKINLGTNDGIKFGENVYLASPAKETELKSMFYHVGGQRGVSQAISKVNSDSAILDFADISGEVNVKVGWIVEAFARVESKIIGAEAPREISVETRLRKLVSKKEMGRKTNSCLGMTLSALVGSLLGGSTDSGAKIAGVLIGFGGIGYGLFEYSTPSQLEIDFGKMEAMPDFTRTERQVREELSAGILKKHAEKAAADRTAQSLMFLGEGCLIAVVGQNTGAQMVGALFLIPSFFTAVIKTDVETEYDEYIKMITATAEGAAK
jgi:hypothetical protein